MDKYYVNLSTCTKDDLVKYKSILDTAFDTYFVANKPFCYEVMWDYDKPLSDFIPSSLIQLL